MRLEQLYGRLPIAFQHAGVSLRGLSFRLFRSSDATLKRHLAFLLSSQWWTGEQFRDYQLQELRRLLKRAFEEVPFYSELGRSLGCAAEDFKSLEDLRLLPVLTKDQLRGREDQFANRLSDREKRLKFFTSGTTGTPLNLFETVESFSKRYAFVSRLRVWAGVSNPFYPKRAQFTGRDIIPESQSLAKRSYWRHNAFCNSLLFSTTHISAETAPYYAAQLVKLNPELIDGYPSAIRAVAAVCLSRGLELPNPKAIIVTAETLLPEHRTMLERAYRCKVFNQYAASEPSCFWSDCEHGKMHINPEYGISEVVDGQGKPVAAGTEGRVVVTSFLNPVMPLIRYALGDLAVLAEADNCPCGRHTPIVQAVTGRMDDILFVPERGYVGRLDPAFKGLSNIVEAQIIQETLDRVTILLVPDAGYQPEIGLRLKDNLRAKLGAAIQIDLITVSQIPRAANGKFRTVISKVRHLYPSPL